MVWECSISVCVEMISLDASELCCTKLNSLPSTLRSGALPVSEDDSHSSSMALTVESTGSLRVCRETSFSLTLALFRDLLQRILCLGPTDGVEGGDSSDDRELSDGLLL